jgi:segregation and condensation protein B
MEPNEKKVEAVLFAVGKEISSERIASLCEIDIPEVENIMQNLIETYKQSDNALQILSKENGWKLTVKDEHVPLVSSIVSSTEMEGPVMDTLAVIAWKYPIVQSDVIKLRGSGAYEHMKQLEERGLVAKEKFQRTFKVKLTGKFFEYFDLPSEEAKQAFLSKVPPEVLQDGDDVEKESNEVERLIDLEQKEKASRNEIKRATEGVKEEPNQ